jgi:hypothetical protein
LISGEFDESDMVFFDHELLEAFYMEDGVTPYEDAHALAEEQFNWYELIKGRF